MPFARRTVLICGVNEIEAEALPTAKKFQYLNISVSFLNKKRYNSSKNILSDYPLPLPMFEAGSAAGSASDGLRLMI